ncbi:unnamed protein product [Macrosiphum euphorbiae]|uniref:HAT C-terminal dimerisation domain-containing protein n=1 Tax=Macrosiphum euphorbiae TaxID=13131 RepID=A0AAV0WRV2_9HEMI|nr:unnamed protein product [Macrosiphum euphorbiae]
MYSEKIQQLQSTVPEIIEALTNISEWNELDSSFKSKTLLTAMCTCEFIISIKALSSILCITAPISRILQGIDNDILAEFELATIKTGYTFDDDLLKESQLKSEIQLWKEKWKKIKNDDGYVIKDALTAIDQCNGILYPNIKKILFIIACLPVTVASAERNFSTLRRLKTWLPSSMGQDRLVGLPLLNIHRDIEITVDEVIEELAKKSRRLEFIL